MFARGHTASMNKLLFASVLSASSVVLVAACATDNGSTVHGPTFGELPGRDGGADGEASEEDAATTTDSAIEEGGVDGATPTCTEGTAVVLAGDDTSLSGAVQSKGGAWTGAAINGGAAKSKPAIVPFGSGFLGVTHGPGDVLQSLTFGTSWAPPTTIGTAGVKGAPALATVGTKAHVVYAAGPGANRDFTHGIHDGTAWDAAVAAVGSPPSFGTVSAALAGVGGDLFFAENGSDKGLYTRTFATAWQASSAVTGAGTVGNEIPATPELVAMAGKYDLVLVYVEKDTRYISFAKHDAMTKQWVDGDVTNTLATTNEKLAASRSGESSLLVTFRGQDGNGYYTQGSLVADTYTWSAPAPIGGGPAKIPVDSTPAVARGVCGDDAIVAYASAGVVRALHLRGAQWSQPEVITGTSGTRVAVSTR